MGSQVRIPLETSVSVRKQA